MPKHTRLLLSNNLILYSIITRTRALLYCIVLVLAHTFCAPVLASGTSSSQPSKGLIFFYRIGEWLDNYSLKGLDTAYITLPEHSWRIAFTNSEMGIHSTFTAHKVPALDDVILKSTSTPSIDIGFNIGCRSLGFGYSWDALHAYAQKLNFSIGGKAWGLEFMHHRNNNIRGVLTIPSIDYGPEYFQKGAIRVTDLNLSVWYALNAAHYSHNAAVKQAYIQRKSAGSLLLSATYASTDFQFVDSLTTDQYQFHNVSGITTRQASIGLGYGINYTPNKGKVLLHLSATAKLVFYTVNHVSFFNPDTVNEVAVPNYAISPAKPVHVTGTMRAAVSWEINQWVHLSARAQVDNMRFRAVGEDVNIELSNWNWQAHLNIAVRLGVGRSKVKRALDALPKKDRVVVTERREDHVQLPVWFTDYFFSPTR
jgi:hypothetical protein